MKANVGGLARGEMEQIVQLLVEAQNAQPDQRDAKLSAARTLVRDVVVRLMAERQKLDRRMQVARLSNDVRQLIALQTRTHEATRSLPQRQPDERDRLAVSIVDDQADVV